MFMTLDPWGLDLISMTSPFLKNRKSQQRMDHLGRPAFPSIMNTACTPEGIQVLKMQQGGLTRTK